MKEITIETPAKINFSIDVTGKLPNGYHSLEMLMQSISLFDTVTVKKRNSGISIECDYLYVPNDSRNTAWKAAEAFFAESPEKGGAEIHIKKTIPVSSGLAGGSSDAAAVILALNKLYGGCLSHVKLVDIAKKAGADVPFCLQGGTALARGAGDELVYLPNFSGFHVVVVKPPFPVSTAWVFANLRMDKLGERPNTSALISAIQEMDVFTLAKGMRNVLESVTVSAFSEIGVIMRRFMELSALGSRMSGSGSAVFGLFEDQEKAENAANEFMKKYEHVFYVKTISRREEWNG